MGAVLRAIVTAWRGRVQCYMPLCGRAARYTNYCRRHFVDIHAPRPTRAVRR